MKFSDVLKKSVHNMLSVKKADTESANAPLFIQNNPDTQTPSEENEEFIIDIPKSHSKLKKKSDEETVKSETATDNLTKPDTTDLSEIRIPETADNHQAPHVESQKETKSIDLGDISIQTHDLSVENEGVITENPQSKKKEQKKNKKKRESQQEQPSDISEVSFPEKAGLSDLSQKKLSSDSEPIKTEDTPDNIHQNENLNPSEEKKNTVQDDQNKVSALIKFKEHFSDLTTSGFFKRKDFKCGVGVLLLCLVILTGSIITSKQPVSSETFASLAAESGLTVTDITSAFSETTPGVVNSHTAISETGWTADFDVFSNGDIAEQNLEKNVKTAMQYKNDSLLEKESNRNNIRIYSLTSKGYFFYIARIDNTLLSIAALDSNREAAETFIAKLGYQQ